MLKLKAADQHHGPDRFGEELGQGSEQEGTYPPSKLMGLCQNYDSVTICYSSHLSRLPFGPLKIYVPMFANITMDNF